MLCRSLQKERYERISLVTLFKRAARAKWVKLSFHFSNTRAISSLWKSDSLFLRVGFAPFWRGNWKLELKIHIKLFGFAFIKNKREWFTLHCSHHSLQKEWNEQCALLKGAKEQFTLFCQKTTDSLKKPKSEFPTLSFSFSEKICLMNVQVNL